MKKEIHSLTEGPIAKSIIAFSLPILLSNLLQQVYNSVDSAILGWAVGADALAAAGSVGSLFQLLIGLSLGLANGVNILYSIQYGAAYKPALKKLISNSLLLSVIASAVIALFGTVFSDWLLQAINTPSELLESSKAYLSILSMGAIATLIYNVGAGILQAEGDSVRPLIFLAVGGLGNFALDLLLVVCLDMGISGAAWATVLAQSATAVLVLLRLSRLNPEYALRLESLSFDTDTAGYILRLALPCGLQSSMFNISNLLVQAKINTFGAVIMAGYTAYCKVDAFVYMPIFAFSTAMSTFTGQNKGAGHPKRIRQGIKTTICLTMGVSGLLAAVVLGFTAPLLHLFTDDAQAVAFGVRMARYLMPFVAVYSVSDILGSAVRGFGQSVPVTVISLICICLFRVVWLEVLFRFSHNVRIIFLCYPISWLLCVAAVTIYYFRHSQVFRAVRDTGRS